MYFSNIIINCFWQILKTNFNFLKKLGFNLSKNQSSKYSLIHFTIEKISTNKKLSFSLTILNSLMVKIKNH
jgi:hypothetical protein